MELTPAHLRYLLAIYEVSQTHLDISSRSIAEKLGVEPKFVEGEWDGLLAGLDAGRYDIMVNGVDITPERAEKYDFSTPYAYNRTAVITQKDNDSIKALEDLNGKTTANTISSTYAELAEQYGATVTGVDDLNQTIELLLSGRIDATLNAEVVFADYQRTHPDANIQMVAFSDEPERVAIPVRKGAPPCWRPSTTLWPRWMPTVPCPGCP